MSLLSHYWQYTSEKIDGASILFVINIGKKVSSYNSGIEEKGGAERSRSEYTAEECQEKNSTTDISNDIADSIRPQLKKMSCLALLSHLNQQKEQAASNEKN